MKIKAPWVHRCGGFLAAHAVRGWMSTLDYQGAFHDPAMDTAHPDWSGQKIYIFWHEYILFPLYLRGHNNLAMLLSRHQDAEALSHAARHMGYEFVRGSSRKGGAAALRELLRRSGRMNLAITPDGPRGPRRKLAQGPVYLSSKLGLPIVAMGFGFADAWRMPTWDRFALPKPGTRARGVVSPAIQIPPDLDRDGLEHYRVQVEAEDWATSGARYLEQVPALPAHPHRGPFRLPTPELISEATEPTHFNRAA